jgi:transcriptional regulator with GAF, ATPase, and Fis domain
MQTSPSEESTKLTSLRLGGRYTHVRELGRGAIGRVVLVEDAIAGGLRAAKIVGDAHGERLRWELALLTSLSHPNLAAVYELLRVDAPLGEPFALDAGAWVLIEELAPGRPSDAVAHALPDLTARVRFALAVGRACARALAAIHAAGLVHGDVKPANVVVPDPPADPGKARLVDFGLAGPAGRGPVAGTPAFLAPEAWLGERTAASDLFALGVTLERWLLPGLPEGSTASSTRERPRTVRASRRAELPEGVPAALARLIDELLREAPDERPASAREVARRLAAIEGEATDASALLDEPEREERARRVAVVPVRGRTREIAAVHAAIAKPSVVVVHGPPGAGRTRVVREAVRALQAERAAAGAEVPTYIAGALPARPTHAAVVHDESGAISLARARDAVRAAELDGVALTIVLERDAPEGTWTPQIAIGPLDDEAMARLATDVLGVHAIGSALRDAACAASSGLPGRLCRLIEGALAAGRDPWRPEVLRSLGREESTALAIPEACRELVDALAVAGGVLGADEALGVATADAIARMGALLASSGLASFGAAGLALRPDRVRRVFEDLSAARRKALARALDRTVRSELARACVDAALGRTDAAQARFLTLAAAEREAGNPLAAADVLRLARERLAGTTALEGHAEMPSDAIAIALGDALRAAGEEREAVAVLASASSRQARAARAELLRLIGEAAEADAIAAQVESGDDDTAIAARCVRARIAWERGELDRAQALADDAAARARHPVPRACEVSALVAIARGDAVAAAEHAAEAERAAAALGGVERKAARARALSLAGSAALIAGASERAAAAYEQALELAESAGERHAAASAAVNLGLARLDTGRIGPAIEALRDGARRLAAIGRPGELGRALYNLANAAFLAGDDALASHAAAQAAACSAESGDRDAAAHAAVVLADLELRAGRVRSAIRALTEIDARGPLQAVIAARLAIAHAALGEVTEARDRAAQARALAAGSEALEADVAIAEARVALEAGEAPWAESLAVRAMAAARTFETRVRAGLIAAETAEACQERSEAAARLAHVRALLDAAAAGLDPAARARLRAVPAYQRALAARPDPSLERSPSTPERADGRALIALARRIAAEHRPGRILAALAAAALDRTGAERAFVLARASDGSIVVRCALGLLGELGPEQRPSRSIAARVIDERRPMVSVDAMEDARLGRAASVHTMALRSVLAVPVPMRDGNALALYVDDRLRPGAFSEGTAADLVALADLASAALANAERWRDERRQARLASRRARELERMLEARGEELRALQLAEGGAGAFAGICAASESMRRVIALASRVAASGVPVLLVGEIGTGKDILARAIHAASARRERAFVAESCAAIPEELLESTLFGHVRGAFTGADRARRGLFEIAHGGTLFLDEVADMSPAMQAKLLRALQHGEIRAVGSERTRRVDVRVIAATSRDLHARIETGAFREDLYWRMAVVTIEIPPLRERVEDIAPLAAALVARHAGGRTVRIDESALEALRAYPWPGNVRQLENELRRALLVAGDVISAEHLSPELRAAAGDPARDLDLKAKVAELERRMIERALAIHGGNQSRAAKALGVSRFGLQKMLKRLGLGAGARDQPVEK